MDKEKIIYQLSVEDIFNVIEENELDVQLSEADITFIEEKIGNYINWFESIDHALWELKRSKEK
jgi:hypothetical protein